MDDSYFCIILTSIIAKTIYSFRIQNVVFYFSIFILFINFINLSIWLRVKNIYMIKGREIVSFVFIIYLLFSYSMQRESILRTAYSDLINKTAYNFDKEMNLRYDKILNSKENHIILPDLKNKPKTIYFDDISEDETDWRNTVYQNYFNKKSIIILKEE